MKYAIPLLFLLSINLYAKTYLCIGETGAGVENTGAGGFKSQVYDVSNEKFVLSEESGAWLLKKIGNDHPVFDHCETEYMCKSKVGYSGIFMRDHNGVFTLSMNTGYKSDFKKRMLFTVKGLCTKL